MIRGLILCAALAANIQPQAKPVTQCQCCGEQEQALPKVSPKAVFGAGPVGRAVTDHIQGQPKAISPTQGKNP